MIRMPRPFICTILLTLFALSVCARLPFINNVLIDEEGTFAYMGDPTFAKRFREAERPGLYCRVIQAGRVQQGDAVGFEPAPGPAVRSLELFRDFYSPAVDEPAIRRFLAAPIAVRARTALEKRLKEPG